MKKGTKLIGLKSIDDDFWQVRLANGQTGYVLNPYISTSKPDMGLTQKAIDRAKIYTVKQTTSFFASPTSPKVADSLNKANGFIRVIESETSMSSSQAGHLFIFLYPP